MISGYLPELIISGNAVFVNNCSNAQSKHLKKTEQEAKKFALLVLAELTKNKKDDYIPEPGQGYWIPSFDFSSGAKYLWSWRGESREIDFLSLGLVFKNERDASEAFHSAVNVVVGSLK